MLCHQGGSRSPSESDHPVLLWGTCAWGLLRQGQLGLSGQKRIFHVSSSRAGLSKAWGRELLQGMPAGVRVPATAPRGRRPQGPFCLCWRGLVAPAGVSHHPCTGGWLWSHSQPQARPWGLCPPVQAKCPAQPPQPFRAASCTGKVFERRSLSCSLCPRKSKLEFDAAPLERRRSLRKRIPEQPRWRRGVFQCFVTVGFPYKATQVCFSPDQALSPQRWSDMTLMVPAQPHPCRPLPGKRSHEFSEAVECGKRSPSTGQVWAVLTATFSVIEKGSLNKN